MEPLSRENKRMLMVLGINYDNFIVRRISVHLIGDYEKFFRNIIPKNTEEIILLISPKINGEEIMTSLNKSFKEIPIFLIQSDSLAEDEIIVMTRY
jgi:late competence protein required for DNA uptake (superfamily II DNA/RNA helicase)